MRANTLLTEGDRTWIIALAFGNDEGGFCSHEPTRFRPCEKVWMSIYMLTASFNEEVLGRTVDYTPP